MIYLGGNHRSKLFLYLAFFRSPLGLFPFPSSLSHILSSLYVSPPPYSSLTRY